MVAIDPTPTSPARPSPSLAPVSAAVLAALRTRITRVGDLGAPAGSPPYAFLTCVDKDWTPFRSLRNPHVCVRLVYQVQCVALDTDGVEFLEHLAREALDQAPVAAGWRILKYLAPDGPGGIRVDRDVTPHLAFSTPQWRLWAQPA